MAGIGYAYVIGRDGTIYWCWDWTVVSYHVGDSNKHALGICLVGDFRTQTPTSEQYKSTVELVRWLQTQIPNATAVKGHSEYPGYTWKSCSVISTEDLRGAVAATGEGEEPMTAEERKAFIALQNQVAELAKANAAYKDRIQALEKLHRMDVPSWAKASAVAAVNAGLINTPDGGSYDFYRFLTLSHRAKLF